MCVLCSLTFPDEKKRSPGGEGQKKRSRRPHSRPLPASPFASVCLRTSIVGCSPECHSLAKTILNPMGITLHHFFLPPPTPLLPFFATTLPAAAPASFRLVPEAAFFFGPASAAAGLGIT